MLPLQSRVIASEQPLQYGHRRGSRLLTHLQYAAPRASQPAMLLRSPASSQPEAMRCVVSLTACLHSKAAVCVWYAFVGSLDHDWLQLR